MRTQQALGRLRCGESKRAFTLVEIMIVIAIIALVSSIAIPYFVTYRSNAQGKACISNLRSIEYAKEQWAMETKKSTGNPCDLSDLVGANAYIKNSVKCPTGPGYLVGLVGDRPSCPTGLPNHILP